MRHQASAIAADVGAMERRGPTRGAAEAAGERWASHRVLAALLRGLVLLLPIAAGAGAVYVLTPWLWRPAGWSGALAFLAQAAVVSTATATTVDRATRRLLPLAALFRLSLVFPDEAPSRFRTAMRAGSGKRLERGVGAGAEGVPAAAGGSEWAARLVELLTALNVHDRLTRGHAERVRAYAELIAEELGVTAGELDRFRWGVLLHDIGKLAVPSSILNKQGRPTEEEWAVLSTHPAVGHELLEPLADWLGPWRLAAGQHHERWDGTGYPHGLAGEEISLAGRITAVADAYDVITSRRSYKAAMGPEAARRELVRCAGAQFDPACVRALLNVSLGRLRFAGGPLSVLAELPGAANVTTAVSNVAGRTVTAVLSTASAVTMAVTLAAPAPTGPAAPLELARAAEAALVVASDPPPAPPGTEPPPATSAATAPAPVTPPTTAVTIGTVAVVPPPPVEGVTVPLPLDAIEPPAVTEPEDTVPEPVPPDEPPPPAGGEAPPTSPPVVPAPPVPGPASGPLLIDDGATAGEHGDEKIHVLDNDVPSAGQFDLATFSIVAGPAATHEYRIHDDHIHYKAGKGSSGTDQLTYRICDTAGACGTATLVITITP
jgi:HD-GYP domain-containing protein (c-di-GMP phosphodiesterase class II)